mmetsp:Transcript_18719/g.57581  ORF Transcript_18719/g.57581 Transcript_18719/m.57581 type:complete len:353 (-) Transcript_18719:351-1409(-)
MPGVWWQEEDAVDAPLAVKGATLVRYEEKKCVLFGGFGGGFSKETFLLDLATRTWQRLATPTEPPRRAYHSSIQCLGRVWIFGGAGANAYFNDCWSLVGDDWERADARGSLPRKREGHTAAAYGESMVVFGGFDGVDFLNDVACLDLRELVWRRPTSTTGAPPAPRSGHTIFASPVVVDDGAVERFFVCGGYDSHGCLADFGLAIFCLSPALDLRWEDPSKIVYGPMRPPPRYGHTTSTVGDNVYVFGGTGPVTGYGSHPSGAVCYNDIVVLSFANPTKPTFRRNIKQRLVKGTPPPRRHCHAAAADSDSFVVFGGSTTGPFVPQRDKAPRLLSDLAGCVFTDRCVAEGGNV